MKKKILSYACWVIIAHGLGYLLAAVLNGTMAANNWDTSTKALYVIWWMLTIIALFMVHFEPEDFTK